MSEELIPTIQTISYNEALAQYSDAIASQMMTISLILAFFNIWAYFYFSNIETPSWKEMLDNDDIADDKKKMKLLQACSTIAMVAALYLAATMISYKTGWF